MYCIEESSPLATLLGLFGAHQWFSASGIVPPFKGGLGLKPQKGGWGEKPPELDILQKLHYLRKGDKLFSHTFCLLIRRLNANTTERICMQISRNIVNGPKSNNWVLMGIWIIVCIHKPSHHLPLLQTFRPLRMFKIVFHDSSLYPKQLSLFCLLWLISANFAKTLIWKTWIWRQIMTSQITHTK